MNQIEIKCANTHNLKNVSLSIPRNKLVVITGPSGSGKSSLAFDTIYQEGQRRYLESLTSSGAPFMQQMIPVDVEYIKGLSPTLSLDQKSTIANRRSTVGTVTEIYDYLRILFSRCAVAHSPESGRPIVARTENEIVDEICEVAHAHKVMIFYPAIKQQKGAHHEVLTKAEGLGFHTFRINGVFFTSGDTLKINKYDFNDIDIVVDRILVDRSSQEKMERLHKAVKIGLQYGNGNVGLILIDTKEEFLFSSKYFCPIAKKSYPSPHPVMFSYNSPKGQCPNCLGLGTIDVVDENKIIEYTNLSIDDQPMLSHYLEYDDLLKQKIFSWLKKVGLSSDTPLSKFPKKDFNALLFGNKGPPSFIGLVPYVKTLFQDPDFESVTSLDAFLSATICPSCHGKRLLAYPLSYLYHDKNIDYYVNLGLVAFLDFFRKSKLQHKKGILLEVEKKLVIEITQRTQFLLDVGLGYLTLNRVANSLSGGELQRIRLASQLGSKLSGVVYILDEPSIGLHQRDNLKLIDTLKNLRDLGNTILVVEHDEETIRLADHVVDIGPGAGVHGGEILFNGRANDLILSSSSTGMYLSKKEKIEVPQKRRSHVSFMEIKNCSTNNLKNVECVFPLKNLTAITGVSGSGKSTLIHNELVPALKRYLQKQSISTFSVSNDKVDDLNAIDQKPIGRSPKSIPLSYCGIFDNIRQLFANTMSAKVAGLTSSHFSFNVKTGRCPKCEGSGSMKFEMPYLNESYITCPVCNGKRFQDSILSIKYRGLNIDDVLNLTIEHATDFFSNHRKIHYTLKTMNDIGLGYLRLGQSSTSLSGGEAQRIKLAKSLSKMKKGHVVYILDEPTTGLHFQDIKLLLKALNALVDQGNTVIVIEHNLDLIKCADYVIDLGPDGGDKGGSIVTAGSPEKIAKAKNSLTGKFLNSYLV